MAQLRQEYAQFVARDAEIVVVAPEDRRAVESYWQREDLPFPGLADPAHAVARLYGQEFSLLKFGRLPALLVIDKAGQVRYAHYGSGMQDIVPNRDLLAMLEELNQEERTEQAA